jgi:hypothetical protein
MLQKTTANGFVKNTTTNLVLNNNQSEYQLYLMQSQKIERERAVQSDIEYLKKELRELKQLFQQCMNGKSDV